MKLPARWTFCNTGGGCTALSLEIPDSCYEWLVTQEGDPSAPTDESAPCVLGFYLMGNAMLQWRCSCLAEALQIAEGAKP